MLIFLDVETTGLELEDKICSIALIAQNDGEVSIQYELVNEGRKIPPKASSIHHITNEMIDKKPKLIDTAIYRLLNEYNMQETTIVGHNIFFDMQKLQDCGFKYKGTLIDTLRVSKHLIEDSESYALQFLRYDLKLYKNEEENIVAHNALSDAHTVKSLYEYFLENTSQITMCDLSFQKVLMQKFTFGKYAGRYIEEISMCDRGYLEWMLSQVVDLDDDLRYSIDYYLQG